MVGSYGELTIVIPQTSFFAQLCVSFYPKLCVDVHRKEPDEAIKASFLVRKMMINSGGWWVAYW